MFCLILSFLIPLVTSEHCDKSILAPLFKCSDIASNLTTELQKLAHMPPASEMGIYVDLCESYLNCLEGIECPDAQKYLHPREKSVATMCSGMRFMAGPFGQCVEQLRSNIPSLKKYPCARHLINEKGRPGNCQMYQGEYDCTTSLIEDRCGKKAMEELETHKAYVLSQMHCK
ncbi:unnamed protein product [Caenorhabditis sp. 36 PRJEB53466]|nr:unnamed protein product [Caenorhabditis sp. 36 PRJEB53466]